MTITPQQQLGWIIERLPLMPVERLPLGEAAGRTLADEVVARHALPIWDNAAMDGYALRSADIVEAGSSSPVTLRVVGEVPAGSGEDPPLHPGEAVRIMTGAPLPTAADAVVAVEHTIGEAGSGRWADSVVQIAEAAVRGRNVRRSGEDVAAGAVLARAGAVLGAARRAALAAAGVDCVAVRALPRVAVIATGAELRAAGEPLGRGEIHETNAGLVEGLLTEMGITAVSVRSTADCPDLLAKLLEDCSRDSDVIITTGGIGPGLRDVTRLALENEPGVRSSRVALRPGQLQCAGTLRSGAFVFALPGNPVSAAVSFELFVRPSLLSMQGRSRIQRLRIRAKAAADWKGKPGNLQVLPVTLSNEGDEVLCAPAVHPLMSSHAVGGHGSTDGYALLAPEIGDVRAGDSVPVMLIGS